MSAVVRMMALSFLSAVPLVEATVACSSADVQTCSEFYVCCARQCKHSWTINLCRETSLSNRVHGTCECCLTRKADEEGETKDNRSSFLTQTDFDNIRLLPAEPNTEDADDSFETRPAFQTTYMRDGRIKRGVDEAPTPVLKRWPDGIVPVVLSSQFDSTDRARIAKAIKAIEDVTCVRFVARTNQANYVEIIHADEEEGSRCCWADIGMNPERHKQNMCLGSSCVRKHGSVLHEFMHTLGFSHEHNRHDRNDYVTVYKDNIRDGAKTQFRRFGKIPVHDLGVGYDYGSIMHYSGIAYRKRRGLRTIVPKRRGVSIGQRYYLSTKDIKKINVHYWCLDM